MIRLLNWFRADETVETVLELDLDSLSAQGKCALLFDLDNTLEPGRPQALRQTTKTFLLGLLARGFRVGVLSNRRFLSEEARRALHLEGVPMAFHAGKPRKKEYCRLLRQLGAQTEDAVFVGDRRLTDTFGARRTGLSCIRVRRPMP